MKKKILFVIPRMGGGGAERVVSLLANELSSEYDVSIFTFVGGESFYHLNDDIKYESVGVSINRKNKLTALWCEATFFPYALSAIYKKIKNDKYDIVVSMLAEADILVGLSKLFGCRFRHVCSERNDPTKLSKFKLSILNQIYKTADLFVCQGQMVCDFYKNVPANIKKIIPNPIDGNNLPKRPSELSKRVVAVGRLNPQKNFPLLIDSFSMIYKDFPEYKLDIYGEGPERKKLTDLIHAKNMDANISLCGAMKNIQQLISDAELFVMSSDYEGFPNALLEAMSIGLPVISTDFPTGIAHELISEKNGIVVPTNAPEVLADAMRKLLSDEKLRCSMGKNNREKCKQFYINEIVSRWKAAIFEMSAKDDQNGVRN